jgi:acetyl-CoA carboxylase carboxyltransferase component
VSSILRAIIELKAAGANFAPDSGLVETLDHVIQCTDRRFPFVADNARQASYELFLRERFVRHQRQVEAELYEALVELGRGDLAATTRAELVRKAATMRHSMLPLLVPRCRTTRPEAGVALELTMRRIYERFNGERPKLHERAHGFELRIKTPGPDAISEVFAATTHADSLTTALNSLLSQLPSSGYVAVELVANEAPDEATLTTLTELLRAASTHATLARATLTWDDDAQHHPRHITWRRASDGAPLERSPLLRDIHPEAARRLDLWRLEQFELTRLSSDERIFAFFGRARSNPADEVIFVLAEVQSAPNQVTKATEDAEHLLEFEHAYFEAMRVLRAEQSLRPSGRRLEFNRVSFYIRPELTLSRRDLFEIARPLEASTRGLGIQKIVIKGRIGFDGKPPREMEIVLANPSRNQLQIDLRESVSHPISALSPYQQSVIRARRLGLVYPYELIKMLRGESTHVAQPHPDMAGGSFVEYDLATDDPTKLVPVERAFGENEATLVVGLVSHQSARHPDGMTRVFIASDPTMAMGALAEPECRRIIAALDLADELGIPVEWLPVSSGARISMDSGTENLDWTAAVLRRIIEFTQSGGEVNVIVHGVNVGAQSYWNAEATMLQHTRGVLIMTPQASMVLTGKKALEYSGSVAAEDERGIGGVDRVMGPNGQAQYIAESLGDAYRILFEHYRYTYRRRSDRRIAPFTTRDPSDRSIMNAPYQGAEGFSCIGEIFSDATNPGRKRPFAIREVMRAVIDADSGALERYQAMAEADTAVIWDAHIGGHAACVIGFESRPLQRHGRIPMDGPDTWTGGTLFPQSSKKVARALNAASGNRPVVVIANLSGFDGSPESMRRLQLEYGAEIGRAVVNFDGPIVFVVVGRYHGGAYVVFSKTLNPRLTSLALEGAYASVIGGAPAAAVVFPRDVKTRALADKRVKEAQAALAAAAPAQRPKLREQLDAIIERVTLEKQGEVAAEFDSVHSVQRAVQVGSLDGVITPDRLRPAIIEVLDREQPDSP